jgi:hypothetical protein
MEIKVHRVNDMEIAELVAGTMLITTAGDGLDLLGSLYFQGFDKVIIHSSHITPAFFDLKTGIAGEVLQKFSNYRVHLAIVGDFSSNQSRSMQDFISESNRSGHINFVDSTEKAIDKLLKRG